jgi:hypothetical protein
MERLVIANISLNILSILNRIGPYQQGDEVDAVDHPTLRSMFSSLASRCGI